MTGPGSPGRRVTPPRPPLLPEHRTGGPLPARMLLAAALLVPVLAVMGGAIPPCPALAREVPHGTAPPITMDPDQSKLAQARGLLRLGKTEEGLQMLRDLHKQNPDDPRIVRILGSTLEATGRRSEAMALYRDGADHAQDPGASLIELERLYREDKDWPQAMSVCLEYLHRLGDRGGWVANEIESLIRTDRIGDEAVKTLEDASKRQPSDDRLSELLVLAFLYQGKADRAVEQAASMDHDRKARGKVLLRVATEAEDKGSLAAALDGYERILKLDPDAATRSEALYRKATVLRKMGRTNESLSALAEAASASGRGPYALRARLERAEVLDRDMHQPEEALKTYQEVLRDLGSSRGASDPKTADQVHLAMADCELRLGRPSEASRLYQAVADSGSDPETQGAALFQVGEMLFYQGKLKEAEDTWYKLTDKFPTLKWVNDALARILLLGEKSDEGGVPVTAYAQAEYQKRLGKIDTGLKLVDDALAQYPKSRAADNLLFERVTLLLAAGRIPEARTAADTLAARFPQSLLAPRALLELADELSRHPEMATEANATYMEVLVRFPDSIEAADARDALQKLKDRTKVSALEAGPREKRG